MNWETTFNTTLIVKSKLHDAERRLKAPMHDILNRWIIDEKISTGEICGKLDITRPIVNRLIEHFGLTSQHDINLKNRKKIKSKFN